MGYFGLIVQKNGGYCESYDGLRGGKYRHTNCEYGEKSKNCWRGKTEEEKKVSKNVIVGAYDKSLTKRGEYRALIGLELT